MIARFKRLVLSASSAAALGLCLSMLPAAASAQIPIKMTLNWKYEGAQAWFFLAQERGYFKAEGLDVQIDQGEGSAAGIPKVAAGTYTAAFGDMNALIDLAGRRPADAPVGVFMLYNVAPFAVAVKKDSPIKEPKDFEGRTLGGAANDGALKLFPTLAKIAGVDRSKVKISNMAPNLREQMLLRNQVDGVFGYVNTIWFAAKLSGMNPELDMRFIKYADYGLDLYSNTVMFSRKFVKEHPEAVKGFLRALNKAIKDVVADPDAGIAAVLKREPLLKRDLEKEKLLATLKRDMSHPEIARIGLGDVDDARLKRAIGLVVEANQLESTPDASLVFDRSFLPPREERLSHF
ncbi:MAG: ABC transporter substrate-binding protein [Pigmentiphaga sp.]|uniref:ABC transporter substrate-binding protein n=1 Tax=Pigmentiphaga sp. TaxID=1977564 RepID=UPI0029AB7A94|nr:ABC transporter substrate-binding protein [Pigmentiphaga sp.]MDX3906896.1 ABC transporter substrate-binding protein [Pigmentiphaga sp.]